MFDSIRLESERLGQLADSNGIDFSGIAYSNPKSFEAKITSPRAVRYVALIREFDLLVSRFDVLWLSGSIPDGSYSRNLYEGKRKLLRLAGEMRNLAGRAIAAAKREEKLAPEAISSVPVSADVSEDL